MPLAALAAGYSGQALAAERAAQVYLLGFGGPLAGVAPPLPGFYFQNDMYFYGGDAGASKKFQLGGKIVGKVDADVFVELPTFIWVPSTDILGGTLGLSASFPTVGPQVTASASLTGPRGNTFGRTRTDSIATYGDPYLTAFMGWKNGYFHWLGGVSVNVPIGDYEKKNFANVAFHRWAADVFGAATYLDPTIGIDLSAKVGITFNGENPATNYKTGTEFHAEWAASKYLSKDFSVGFVGYFYDQLTGDSGKGDRLGPFEGRVIALGGTAGYNFQIGELPVSTRVKVYREFDTKNRLQGTAGFLTVSMPISVVTPQSPLVTK